MDEVRDQPSTPSGETPQGAGKRWIWWAVAAVAVLAIGTAIIVSGGDGGGLIDRITGQPSNESASPQPATSQPSTSTPTGSARPTAPAPAGSQLATVTQPPESTLAMLNAGTVPPDARVNVSFSPFGYGPPSQGKTVVVRITEATALSDIGSLELKDRNVLAVVGPGEPMPEKGGTYSGVLMFRPEGELLIPVLTGIAAQ